MKSGTTGLLKFLKLKHMLGLRKWQAVGVLQTLWEFTAENSPRGDIGRHPDADIAFGMEWEGDPHVLIQALVETGWLDTDTTHRLVVHDWAEHCEAYVRKRLMRVGQACIETAADNGGQRQTTADNGGQRLPTHAGARAGLPMPDPISAEINPEEPDTEMPNPDQRDLTKGRERPLEIPLKKILYNAISGQEKQRLFRSALLKRLDMVAQDGPAWVAWWRNVIQTLDVDGLLELERLVEYAEECGNPTIRGIKGLGKLKKPGAFIASRLLKWAHKAKVALPEFPEAAKGAPRAGSAGKPSGRQGETAPRLDKANTGHSTRSKEKA